MRSWRSRIVTAMMIYGAGIATALYALAPATDRPATSHPGTKDGSNTDEVWKARSEQWAMTAGVQLRRFVSFAEEKAIQVSEVIRKKLAEQRCDSEK